MTEEFDWLYKKWQVEEHQGTNVLLRCEMVPGQTQRIRLINGKYLLPDDADKVMAAWELVPSPIQPQPNHFRAYVLNVSPLSLGPFPPIRRILVNGREEEVLELRGIYLCLSGWLFYRLP